MTSSLQRAARPRIQQRPVSLQLCPSDVCPLSSVWALAPWTIDISQRKSPRPADSLSSRCPGSTDCAAASPTNPEFD